MFRGMWRRARERFLRSSSLESEEWDAGVEGELEGALLRGEGRKEGVINVI